jgi:pimeloyl-ACP methyl ester carboxylesterase
MKKEIIFKASDGKKIRATLFGQENIGDAPCIIFVHGFKGFKDWGFWPYMGEYFASKGFVAISFNFSHNGVGESLTEFDELDKFAENTFSREVRELSEIVDACKDGFFGGMKTWRIGLLGHSRGGGIALATATRNPDVAAVALWASTATFDRYTDHQREEWRSIGYYEIINQRTKQVMRMNVTLLDDLDRHKDDLLNLEKAVRTLNRPLFIAHGEQDLSVPSAEGKRLFECSDRSLSEFHLIPKTGHTFGIVHPFAGSCETFDLLLDKTGAFFAVNLR